MYLQPKSANIIVTVYMNAGEDTGIYVTESSNLILTDCVTGHCCIKHLGYLQQMSANIILTAYVTAA